MNADVKGALKQLDKSYRFFEHKGMPMSKEQVRIVLQYALSKGYETTDQLTAEEVDFLINRS